MGPTRTDKPTASVEQSKRKREFPETKLEDVVGCLKYKAKAKTIAQMDAAIAREIRRRHKLGEY